MSSKDPVLLGFIDTPIPVTDHCSYQVNKVGGAPDWMTNETDARRVICRLCSSESVLVCQIYCPLGQGSSHRTLYLFCCLNHQCWNKSDSWTVLRCQQGEQIGLLAHNGSREEKVPESSLWLSHQDDWDDDVSEDTAADGLCSATEKLALPRSPVRSSEVAMDDDSNESDNLATAMSQVIPEPFSSTFVGELPWKISVQKTVLGKHVLCPFYISVSEECNHETDSTQHVDDLLQNYQQHTGNPFYKVKTGSSSDESSRGMESYEKSDVKHGDKCFYKFQKKLSKLPQQIVRYQWGGEALLIRPYEEEPPTCQSCGAQRVFEFQLMPTLVPSLKLQNHDENNNDPPVEFGTVIVLSCTKSCWKDGDVAKAEHVFVQSDPDENLFKRGHARWRTDFFGPDI